MRPVTFVGPWDLDRRLAALPATPSDGTVLLVRSRAKGSALPWHKQKLILVLAAQQAFVEGLRRDGFTVDVLTADTYADGIRAGVQQRGAASVRFHVPRDIGVARALTEADLGAPKEVLDDGGEGGHFLLSRADVLGWMRAQKGTLRMDSFYRFMRRRTGWLMEGDAPVGGRWSFDVDNRRAPPPGLRGPRVPIHPVDAATADVIARVRALPGTWGSADGFSWPVTREAALAELRAFVDDRLAGFGDWQDAMVTGQPWLWHARLSVPLNLGLLHPREVADAVVDAFHAGRVPLNAAEGMLRQVIGWREFIRGVYLHRMPGLRTANLLGAERPLPAFFWEPERTDMACVREAVSTVHEHGYAHHIQRLMVLGNLALLAGLQPLDVSHWFWAGFVDAHEWVELPNVHGMALFADDGFTTKPYAASGAYIDRMSDHCGGCRYRVGDRHGPSACPFNPLFWTFLDRHRARFVRHPRLGALYRSWDRWSDAERAAIRDTAARIVADWPVADHGWTFDDDAG